MHNHGPASSLFHPTPVLHSHGVIHPSPTRCSSQRFIYSTDCVANHEPAIIKRRCTDLQTLLTTALEYDSELKFRMEQATSEAEGADTVELQLLQLEENSHIECITTLKQLTSNPPQSGILEECVRVAAYPIASTFVLDFSQDITDGREITGASSTESTSAPSSTEPEKKDTHNYSPPPANTSLMRLNARLAGVCISILPPHPILHAYKKITPLLQQH